MLTILLILPFVCNSQGTYKWTFYNGEYAKPMIDSIGRAVIASANLNLTGNGGSGSSGVPLAISTPGVTFVSCNNTLHGSNFISSTGTVYVCGGGSDGELGVGDLSGRLSLTKILTDSRGVTFDNITITQGSYIQIGANSASGLFFVKHGTSSDTLFYTGHREFGISGDGFTGNDTLLRPTIVWSLPSGKRIIQMCGSVVMAALLNDGTVQDWGANNITAYLGRSGSYSIPLPVTGFDDSIRQICGGAAPGMLALSKNDSLWGWGNYSQYLGHAAGGAYSTPHILTALKDSMENIPARTKITQIASNSNCFHAILNDSTLFGWGDNGMGSIGNGVEPNLAAPGGTSAPWSIDPSAIMVLAQTYPVQVTKKHNFVSVSTGCLFAFCTMALSADGQLYDCGRNKGGVIPNGMIECSGAGGDIAATYANSWDVPYLTPVNPYGITSSIGQSCPGCKTGAVTTFCSECTIPTTTPTANAGSNQNITTATTTLDGSGSTCTGGKITYYLWTQVSGAASTIDVPAAIKPNISGLIPGTYVFNLKIIDNGFNSSNQNVTVSVTSPTPPPSGGHIYKRKGTRTLWIKG